jgi:hypothetical protein
MTFVFTCLKASLVRAVVAVGHFHFVWFLISAFAGSEVSAHSPVTASENISVSYVAAENDLGADVAEFKGFDVTQWADGMEGSLYFTANREVSCGLFDRKPKLNFDLIGVSFSQYDIELSKYLGCRRLPEISDSADNRWVFAGRKVSHTNVFYPNIGTDLRFADLSGDIDSQSGRSSGIKSQPECPDQERRADYNRDSGSPSGVSRMFGNLQGFLLDLNPTILPVFLFICMAFAATGLYRVFDDPNWNRKLPRNRKKLALWWLYIIAGLGIGFGTMFVAAS